MGLKLAAIISALLILIMGVFYWYYHDTQKKMEFLITNNARLELGIKMNEETIATLNTNINEANAELTRVNNAFADARQQNNALIDRLAKHELGALAATKPGLVGSIINKASDKASRCFEIMSGSPLTDQERGAKDAKSFNSECPWLWPGTTP